MGLWRRRLISATLDNDLRCASRKGPDSLVESGPLCFDDFFTMRTHGPVQWVFRQVWGIFPKMPPRVVTEATLEIPRMVVAER